MTNKERVKKWRLNNLDRYNFIQKKYRVSIGGKKTTQLYLEKYRIGIERAVILERDKYQCRSCGKKEGKLDIHHIDGNGTAKKREDKNNSLDNLITLCRKCHIKADYVRIMNERKLKGFWSLYYEKCIECGKTDSKHCSKGVCNRCYNLKRKEYKRNYWRINYRVLTRGIDNVCVL